MVARFPELTPALIGFVLLALARHSFPLTTFLYAFVELRQHSSWVQPVPGLCTRENRAENGYPEALMILADSKRSSLHEKDFWNFVVFAALQRHGCVGPGAAIF